MIVLRVFLALWALLLAREVCRAFYLSVIASDMQWLANVPQAKPDEIKDVRRFTMIGGQFLFALLLVCIFLITHL